ncbi:MAG: protein translocase subunit SecD [Candidatus Nanopelagicales bacterium]
MAASNTGRPGRSLLVLVLIMAALGGWMIITGTNTPQLGLDLRGGTTVTLEPKLSNNETGVITDEAIDQAVLIIQQRVDGSGVAEASVSAQGNGENAVIVVSVPGEAGGDLVESLGQTASLSFRPVITVTAGTPLPDVTPIPTPSSSKKSDSGQNGGGQNGGGQSNGAVLPRIDNANNGNGSNNNGDGANNPSDTPSPVPSSTGVVPNPTNPAAPPTSPTDLSKDLQKQFQELDCSDPEQRNIGSKFGPDEIAIACQDDGSQKFILEPVAVQGANVDTATAQLQQQGIGWEVSLDFDSDGTKAFAATTQKLVSQPDPTNRFAIVLDNVVISDPTVNEAILGGVASITGQFTQADATDLANVLKYGALPLAFDIVERATVSPTLGADQLHAGLVAGALGLALVVLYLLMYYRALAVVAVSSLIVAGLLVYGTVVLLGETLGFTLTLAGVAGLIVAIGITADSFIVYFERIRDEVRDGRSLRTALEAGWSRAKRTIIAADFISVIAAVVLYVLSVGGVRGFAFTLGLTTIIDLIVVFLFTKPVITLLARTRFFNSGSKWSGLSPERLGARDATAATTVTARRRSEAKGA